MYQCFNVDSLSPPTNPHNLPSYRITQYPPLSFNQRQPIPGTCNAGIHKLAGENRVGRLR